MFFVCHFWRLKVASGAQAGDSAPSTKVTIGAERVNDPCAWNLPCWCGTGWTVDPVLSEVLIGVGSELVVWRSSVMLAVCGVYTMG